MFNSSNRSGALWASLLFRLFASFLPLYFISLPFWADFLILLALYFYPVLTIPFWVWGLVCAIRGPQDILAYIFYAVFAFVFIFPLVSAFKK